MNLHLQFSNKKRFVNPNFLKDESVKTAADKMILSASGWRKIFGENEESDSITLKEQDKVIFALAAEVFFNYIKARDKRRKPEEISGTKINSYIELPATPRYPKIVVGIDSRPTGPEAAESVIRTLIALGCSAEYLHICAAPEIMAYVKQNKELDGFIYISASHNPKGYNGIKFGAETGAVLGGEDSDLLINSFKKEISNKEKITAIVQLLNSADIKKLSGITEKQQVWKKASYASYLAFNLQIAGCGAAQSARESAKQNIGQGAKQNAGSSAGQNTGCGAEQNTKESTKQTPSQNAHQNIGIVADLNGSARCTSIDKDFLKKLGIKSKFINTVPGKIKSPILPEGENLSLCRKALEKAYKRDNSFIIGYMPDNDGDRGNLVYISSSGAAEILKAQELFALTCFAELMYITESALAKGKKIAVVVNDPTSTRIEKIAHQFGASVHRAEVGEANVVNLALKLIEQGVYVRYLGEGSNGGSITLPATVRDPLNTISAITRLLSAKLGYASLKAKSIDSLLKALPQFTTTETDDPLAKMKIKTADHDILKTRYEKIFLGEWELKKKYLEEKAGIVSWEEINYMQTDAAPGMGSKIRGSRTKGGLKILFKDKQGAEKGFIWMRGSGTEPVFRVMADIEGKNNPLERFLIKWQREMIEKADE
ncbi:MAG: phosphatidylglycerol lysyltransferase [Spirochaetes bacterium]|nr:phosphatidylglycerol lysyltransferase [Spirochaetota bacterium]